LQAIFATLHACNAYIAAAAPWALRATGNAADAARADTVIFVCIETVRIAGILLQPCMPQCSQRLLDFLGVADDARTLAHASFDAAALSAGRAYVPETQSPPLPSAAVVAKPGTKKKKKKKKTGIDTVLLFTKVPVE
jgi:methionyl-tRNA synthetase